MPGKAPTPRECTTAAHGRAHGALLQGAGHAGENTDAAQMHHSRAWSSAWRSPTGSRLCRRKHIHRVNAPQPSMVERMALSYREPAMPGKAPTPRECTTAAHGRAHGALLQGAGHAGENTDAAQMHHSRAWSSAWRSPTGSRLCRRKHRHRVNAPQPSMVERMALSYREPAMPAKAPTPRKCTAAEHGRAHGALLQGTGHAGETTDAAQMHHSRAWSSAWRSPTGAGHAGESTAAAQKHHSRAWSSAWRSPTGSRLCRRKHIHRVNAPQPSMVERMALSYREPAMPGKAPTPRECTTAAHGRAHGALLQGAGHAGENTDAAQMHHSRAWSSAWRSPTGSRLCRRKHIHRVNAPQPSMVERMALSYREPAMPAKAPTPRKCTAAEHGRAHGALLQGTGHAGESTDAAQMHRSRAWSSAWRSPTRAGPAGESTDAAQTHRSRAWSSAWRSPTANRPCRRKHRRRANAPQPSMVERMALSYKGRPCRRKHRRRANAPQPSMVERMALSYREPAMPAKTPTPRKGTTAEPWRAHGDRPQGHGPGAENNNPRKRHP